MSPNSTFPVKKEHKNLIKTVKACISYGSFHYNSKHLRRTEHPLVVSGSEREKIRPLTRTTIVVINYYFSLLTADLRTDLHVLYMFQVDLKKKKEKNAFMVLTIQFTQGKVWKERPK